MWFSIDELSLIKQDLNVDKDWLYLDFGHGGTDTGCTFYDGTYEKNYNLNLGKKIYDICSQYIKKVYLTRTIDKTVELSTRANKMNDLLSKLPKGGELHVYSFHCNAFNKIAQGSEILLSKSQVKPDPSKNIKGSPDFIWSLDFLKAYCAYFGFVNRGIIQKEGKNGDYYYLHRKTGSGCKVKYIEFFFGDNREDCKKAQNKEFIDTIAYFTSAYILKRYGIKIFPPKQVEEAKKKVLYTVQVGSYSDKKNAEAKLKTLKSKGFEGIIITKNA